MTMKMLMTAKLSQQLMMSQQLRQAIALLQYNALELRQVIQHHIEINPFLCLEEEEQHAVQNEEDNQDYFFDEGKYTADFGKSVSYSDREYTVENYSQPKNLRAVLLEQTLLCGFSIHQEIIAEAIISAIDKKGYLEMQPEEIFNTLSAYHSVTLEEIQDVLKIIKTFEPQGIASSNIKECFLTQLNNLSNKDTVWEIAFKIVTDYFDREIINKKEIFKKMKISQQQYIDAMNLIRTLNPYPGNEFQVDENNNIEPDLAARKINNNWAVCLADNFHIKINEHYKKIFKENKENQSYDIWRQQLEEAQSLLYGLKRRNETLLDVATHIIKFQYEFLEKGGKFMKPMNMVDVSKALGVHESTVSRVTTGKYISTPRGNFELRYFFSSHVSTQLGENCSATAIKSFIKDIISKETREHIYSDNEITDLLHDQGINIARRTVAKYRESLHISSSYQRQQQFALLEETSC